jgi:hypothetical protein
MGIDEVARFAARPSRWPVTTMTSTVRRTRSAAKSLMSSSCPAVIDRNQLSRVTSATESVMVGNHAPRIFD